MTEIVLIEWVAFSLLWTIPLWLICNKVGYPAILSLAAFVPVIGVLIVFGILAYGSWPRTRETGGLTS